MRPLPDYERAIIPIEKFTQYILDPIRSKGKAVAFERVLGYNIRNVDRLIENIRANLGNYGATEKEDKGYGPTYEVIMELTGETGRQANVLTAWITDNTSGEIRLVSAYIKNVKEGN